MRRNNNISCHFSKINLILMLSWMGVIFYFSSLEGDGVKYAHSIWFYIERKGAHIGEYLVLTLLMINFFIRIYPKRRDVFVISTLSALLYAFSDEIHQLFVFGREGKITDVAFDAGGILIGIILVWIFLKIKNLKIFSKK